MPKLPSKTGKGNIFEKINIYICTCEYYFLPLWLNYKDMEILIKLPATH